MFGREVVEFPAGDSDFIGKFLELSNFSGGEEEAARGFGALAEAGFDLAGKKAFFVAVSEDVIEDGFDIGGLVAVGEGAAGPGVRVDDLEIEASRRFVTLATAFGGETTADESADDFINEGHAVALVRSEGEEGGDFIGVKGFVSIFINGGAGREGLAFALELLDAAHGDGGGGPVDDDGKAIGLLSRESPRVGVGAESGMLSKKRNDFGESGSAVGVGNVAFFGGLHDVAAAPEVVEGVVDGDLSDAVFVGHFNAAVDGGDGDGLAEFFVGVPDFGGFEAGVDDLDPGAGDTAAGSGAEEVVEMEGFERVVGADAVARGVLTDLGGDCGFIGLVATSLVGGGDQFIMFIGWDYVKFAHLYDGF